MKRIVNSVIAVVVLAGAAGAGTLETQKQAADARFDLSAASDARLIGGVDAQSSPAVSRDIAAAAKTETTLSAPSEAVKRAGADLAAAKTRVKADVPSKYSKSPDTTFGADDAIITAVKTPFAKAAEGAAWGKSWGGAAGAVIGGALGLVAGVALLPVVLAVGLIAAATGALNGLPRY